ncbi:MAG: tetratricopeptide repeat protein [Blastocatellia bacterium]|nr:tetratricopeptide repeat protein [Blastocatellia bacterium]
MSFRLYLTLSMVFALFCSGPLTQSVTVSAAQESIAFESDKPVEREIAEGETHSYRISLAADEFLHVFIYQRGVNVAATLIAPDGKKLLEADTPRSTQEAESIAHLAETAGEYGIEVRTVDKGAPAGRYEIKVDERRESAPGDEIRLTAQRAFAEGNRLYGENDRESYRKAIDRYEEALGLYRQAGRRVEEAVTLNCTARGYASVYDYTAAIEYYKMALSIYREMRDLQGEGFTLNWLGNTYSDISRYGEAIGYYEQALEARRKAGYRGGEGGTLGNLGNAYKSLSRYEKAIEYYEQSLAIKREVKDRAGEGGGAQQSYACMESSKQ